MTLFGAIASPVNRLELVATLAQCAPMRYTPAGIPALDLWLEHASEQVEAGYPRQVALRLKAVAFGAQAERLAAQALGTALWWTGFMSSARRGNGVVFHVQDFKPI
ncbi:Primosomal replication protein N [Tepidimonas thermarum]|uniref:Replication restart protein PriB n=1 Tax=Tepidimonas thermarum TaxID=335431 RepID=A0A554X7H2_9BURK|nr:primosomal replication protein N [Tepidimonas thermarum]TSE31781.1 Primosomal replication protein N [Tepidimonas thermarum]